MQLRDLLPAVRPGIAPVALAVAGEVDQDSPHRRVLFEHRGQEAAVAATESCANKRWKRARISNCNCFDFGIDGRWRSVL